MGRRFVRVIEDFTCAHCGRAVVGSGFTNHCPGCLWSRHVDVNPGDRSAQCRGLMRPIAVRYEREIFQVLHQCELCGTRRPNKAAVGDNRDTLITLMAQPFAY